MTSIDLHPGQEGPFIGAPGRARGIMNWLFSNKERMFWILQAIGWFSFFFLHFFSVATFMLGQSADAVIFTITSTVIGFMMSSMLLRPIYRFAKRQNPAVLLTIAIAATIVTAFLMSGAKAQAFIIFFGDEWFKARSAAFGTTNLVYLLLPELPVNLFLLMSWGGFYFGINYYLTLRDETERALVSARLADQAQLKMLRYQLNPHFLFNTLNAISTLVLEKNDKLANKMLTQLSAFLRYSLDSDPLQKTSLAEELRALQLYLEIETTRFGDRLKISIDVDDDVMDAQVPSLILQPAIENAIKYAIAQMESGGVLSILAKREGEMVKLRVCDNGPNAPETPEQLLANATTGVGLVNMRDRLIHLYGARQSFALRREDPQGLCVCLTIPLEK